MSKSGMTDESPACHECRHRAWAHGTQSGFPFDGEPCHAATEPTGQDECPCMGYRHPDRVATERSPEIVHRCPVGDDALTPCCGRSPFELPRWSSRITTDAALVTCGRS